MTRDEAIIIRQQQLCGKEVAPALAAEAIDVIKATAKEIAPDAKPPQGKKKKPKAPPAPKKSDLTKAKHMAAALLDQESKQDRGNRLLLASLRKAMPHWSVEPVESWPGTAAPSAPAPTPTPAETRREAMAAVLTPAGMSYAQAVQVRIRHFNGQPVDRAELTRANRIVAERRARALPKEESYSAPPASAATT